MGYELLFLFFARMADMSLATLRHLLVVRGHRVSAAAIGFGEIVIYLLALGLMLQQPHSILRIVVFGLGYATGIIVGSLIEERLALGSRLLQVTVDGSSANLAAQLREDGCSVTSWRGEGLTGEKHVLHVLVPRRRAGALQETIRRLAPNAFVIALEPRSYLGGLGPPLAAAAVAPALPMLAPPMEALVDGPSKIGTPGE